jgi:hypothetical protein
MDKNKPKWKFHIIYDRLSYKKKTLLWRKVIYLSLLKDSILFKKEK